MELVDEKRSTILAKCKSETSKLRAKQDERGWWLVHKGDLLEWGSGMKKAEVIEHFRGNGPYTRQLIDDGLLKPNDFRRYDRVEVEALPLPTDTEETRGVVNEAVEARLLAIEAWDPEADATPPDEGTIEPLAGADHVRYEGALDVDAVTPRPGDKLVCVRSPKGSGKTQAVSKLLQLPTFSGLRMISISPREAQARVLAERWNAESYKATPSPEPLKGQRVAVCINSIRRVEGAVDIVVLDEAQQLLENFVSSTLEKQLIGVWYRFLKLLREADLVLALDADLTPESVQTLRLLANQPQTRVVDNAFDPDVRGIVEVPTAPLFWLQTFLHVVEAGRSVWVAADSRRAIGIFALLLEAEDINYRKYSSADPWPEDIEADIANVRVVLASPKIDSAVSVARPFDYVMGYFGSHAGSSPAGCLQQLARVRAPTYPVHFVHLSTMGAKRKRETDAERLYHTQVRNSQRTVDRDRWADEEHLLRLRATVQAQRNLDARDFGQAFRDAAKARGLELGRVDHYPDIDPWKAQWKKFADMADRLDALRIAEDDGGNDARAVKAIFGQLTLDGIEEYLKPEVDRDHLALVADLTVGLTLLRNNRRDLLRTLDARSKALDGYAAEFVENKVVVIFKVLSAFGITTDPWQWPGVIKRVDDRLLSDGVDVTEAVLALEPLRSEIAVLLDNQRPDALDTDFLKRVAALVSVHIEGGGAGTFRVDVLKSQRQAERFKVRVDKLTIAPGTGNSV